MFARHANEFTSSLKRVRWFVYLLEVLQELLAMNSFLVFSDRFKCLNTECKVKVNLKSTSFPSVAPLREVELPHTAPAELWVLLSAQTTSLTPGGSRLLLSAWHPFLSEKKTN